jgi:hypothetical protein
MAALNGTYHLPARHCGRSPFTLALISQLLVVEPGSRPSAVTLCRRAERLKEALLLEQVGGGGGGGVGGVVGGGRVGTFPHVTLQSKTPIDDSQYGPCNQSDTRE